MSCDVWRKTQLQLPFAEAAHELADQDGHYGRHQGGGERVQLSLEVRHRGAVDARATGR